MAGTQRTRKYRPNSGVWELTLRCNMNCLHCGSRAGQARKDELTTDELFRLADDLAALGNRYITLSGGEPLLRREWPELTKRLVGHRIKVNMISNGFAFRERELDLAREAGLHNVAFSLDGDAEIHDHIRAKPTAYARVMEAIDLCVRNDYAPSIVTHITNANIHMLGTMAQMLIDKGVRNWQVQTGFDFGNLSDHPDLVLEPAAFKIIIPRVVELMKEHEGKLLIAPGDDMGYFTEEDEVLRGHDGEPDYWAGCQAGVSVIGIEANGNIKGCLSMQAEQFVEGNVREEPLEAIWSREGAFAYTRDFRAENLGGFCRDCAFNEVCRGGCSWNSYLHGREQGKFANRYCLYQVRELEKAGAQR